MAATYMLRKYLRSAELAASPEATAARVVALDAWKRAAAERRARFPRITEGNFEEANTYQNERIAYWTRHLSEEG